nr:ArsR family transcriptional regulator [Salinadaptatus halalkaliphilus]
MDGLVEIESDAWIRGATPDDSRIVPWGVQSIDSADIDFWQGRLEETVVAEAIAALVEQIQL